MTHFALVPHGSAVVVSETSSRPVSAGSDVRQQVHDIYESYATMYPNPLLTQERQERDRLQGAISAASQATQMNNSDQSRRRGTGFFSFLWGSQDKTVNQSSDTPAGPSAELDDRIQYVDDEAHGHEGLCGTDSLDLDCIPAEAHAFARFHLASMRTRGERPNAVRAEWEAAGSSVLIITGLGELVEFSRKGGKGQRQFTSDRNHLQEFVSATGNLVHSAYARAAAIGPNLLAVSWGLPDGIIVFYRRLVGREAIAWEPVASLSASEAIKANIGDVFLEETGSALLRVADICPLVFEVPDAPPGACIAVGRLGGYVEIVTLPTEMWYGPELDPPRTRRSVGRRKGSIEHYASSLRDLALDPISIVALTTAAYSMDCTCLESFRTNVSSHAVWDTETYPDAPPAEYVLAASGHATRGGGEMVCFWSISSTSSNAQHKGFSVVATLIESVYMGPVGPDLTVFANSAIMSLWRRPRKMRLGVEERGSSGAQKTDRVATISVPIPIVSMRFGADVKSDVVGCFLDGNGGIILGDCSLLSRFVAHSLTQAEYDLLFHNEEDEDTPLVKISVSRADLTDRLMSDHQGVGISDVQFLGKRLATDGPLLAAFLPDLGLRIIAPDGSLDVSLVEQATSTSLLRFTFADLMLASTVRKCGSVALGTTIVKAFDSRATVESLIAVGNYAEAVRIVAQMTADEQDGVLDSTSLAHRHIWEHTSSFEALANVSDTDYVFDQALSLHLSPETLGDSECLALFRKVHFLALARLTTGPSMSDVGDMRDQLKDRLIRLGSYELLCEHLGIEKSFESFSRSFLGLKISDLMRELAHAADVEALSILYFRHLDELQDQFELLNTISPMISPLTYCHLLPVDTPRSAPVFLSVHDVDVVLRNWQELPAYLLEAYDLAVVVDVEDQMMVLDKGPGLVEQSAEKGREWFSSRVLAFQELGATVRNTSSLCRLGLRAYPPLEGSSDVLERVLRYLDGLRELSVHMTNTGGSLGQLETSPFSLLEEMDVNSLVAMAVELVDPVMIMYRFQHELVPLIGSLSRSAIDESVLVYCSESFASIDDQANVTDLFLALERCVACATLSKPLLDIESRLVRAPASIFKLVETSFAGTMRVACSLSLNEFQCRRLIDLLWSLYESLPSRIPHGNTNDAEENHMMADEMFEALTVLSIVCEWPGCHAFNIVQSAEGDLLHEHVIRCLCQSFCSQIASGKPDSDSLLKALLSDVRELERISFSPSFTIAPILTRELFLPLFRNGKILLVSQLLGTSITSWIDWEMVSDSMTSFVNEVVYADGDVAQALKYQSLLVQHLPDTHEAIAEVQRALDAAQFTNTILLGGNPAHSIRPAYFRKEAPADVLEFVLSKDPSAIICGCERWADPAWATEANMRLRSQQNGTGHSPYSSEVGEAILHLAMLLGLVDTLSVSCLKYWMVKVSVGAKLHGVAAALCRSLLGDWSRSIQGGHILLLRAIREVVSQSDYADFLTKHELCQAGLLLTTAYSENGLDSTWIPTLEALGDIEYTLCFQTTSPDKALHFSKRLVYDTFCEYRVDLGDLCATLQEQACLCQVDDSILETIARYIAYWCIASCTRKRAYIPPAVDGVSTKAFMYLFLALTMHINDEERALESLRAVHGVMNEQSSDGLQSGIQSKITPDPLIVEGLINRGYSLSGSQRAAVLTGNVGFDSALQWAVAHSLDDNFDAPIILVKDDRGGFIDDESCVFLIQSLDKYHNAIPKASCFLSPSERHKTSLGSTSMREPELEINVSCSESTDDISNVISEPENWSVSEPLDDPETQVGHEPSHESNYGLGDGRVIQQSPAARVIVNSMDMTAEFQHSVVTTESTSSAAELRDRSSSGDTSPAIVFDTANGGADSPFLLSTPVAGSATSRARLLESGHKALQVARTSASPSNEERERLIAEGRRLLQQARGTPSASASQHRYPLRSSVKATNPACLAEAELHLPTEVPPTLAHTTSNGNPPSSSNKHVIETDANEESAWDFEDDALGETAAGDDDGWAFDEDI